VTGGERHRAKGTVRAGHCTPCRGRAGKGLVTVNAGGPVRKAVFESELFRAREGRVHRRQDRPCRPLRAGRRRHALPRRDRERPRSTCSRSCCASLETGDFERVGSSRTPPRAKRAPSSSATNSNLGDEVSGGRFRQDLLFRLNTIEIQLPGAARSPRGHSGARHALSCAKARGSATGKNPSPASSRRRWQALASTIRGPGQHPRARSRGGGAGVLMAAGHDHPPGRARAAHRPRRDVADSRT